MAPSNAESGNAHYAVVPGIWYMQAAACPAPSPWMDGVMQPSVYWNLRGNVEEMAGLYCRYPVNGLFPSSRLVDFLAI